MRKNYYLLECLIEVILTWKLLFFFLIRRRKTRQCTLDSGKKKGEVSFGFHKRLWVDARTAGGHVGGRNSPIVAIFGDEWLRIFFRSLAPRRAEQRRWTLRNAGRHSGQQPPGLALSDSDQWFRRSPSATRRCSGGWRGGSIAIRREGSN
jgi:hypothetical protein